MTNPTLQTTPTRDEAVRSTGCFDKDGNELFVGDHVRYLLEGSHTKREYWNPEYEVVFDPPCYSLKHIGGGKDGGNYQFMLRTGKCNGSMELLRRAPAPASGRVDAVTVKALEWNPFSAETVIGRYDIVDQSDASCAREREGRPPFLLAKPRAGYARFDTLAEARAAAQADYERRIRSALSPAATPVSEAGGEAEFIQAAVGLMTEGRYVAPGAVAERLYALAKPASSPAGGDGLTEAEMAEKTAAALVVMARCNIPTDVQELLVAGNPDRAIPPGILKRVLAEADGRQVRHGALSQSTSAGRVGE